MTLDKVDSHRRPRALICGVSGQDAAFLAQFLIDKGYEVLGTSRDAASAQLHGIRSLGLGSQVRVVSMSPADFRSVLSVVSSFAPDEIYNLAGQSSVGLSFEQPVEAIESVAIATLNFLEAVRYLRRDIRLYNAGSSECFGDTGGSAASEATCFRPLSPYAVAKVCAHNLVLNYRNAYGIRACTGILFNHESPLRPERFVTQKVVRAAERISRGVKQELVLGDVEILRDWGWSPDYVRAMWMMLQRDSCDDYVIATGRSVSLEYFVDRAFRYFGLDYARYLKRGEEYLRPNEIKCSRADPSKAAAQLGWVAEHDIDFVVDAMCASAVAHRI